MKNIITVSAVFLVMALAVGSAVAGTLDNAPFKILVPGKDWLLIDSTAQDVGHNASLVASLVQTNSTLRAVVIKTDLQGVTASSMSDLLAGIRESLNRPDVTDLAEERITFAGIGARQFTYHVTQNSQTLYSDTVVFIVGDAGWTIDCVGPASQKDDVQKMLTYFRKNGP